MREYCAEIAVVLRGTESSVRETALENAADVVIFSKGAASGPALWPVGLESYGGDKLAQYDEILLLDEHVMGPVCPLEDLFARMTEKQADFWGLSVCRDTAGSGGVKLWPHFLAVRGEVLAERCRSKTANSGTEDLFSALTRQGLRWSSAADADEGSIHSEDPMIFAPVELLRDQHLPFFARDAFCFDYARLCRHSLANQGKSLLQYLERSTDYDVSLIWEYLLRTHSMDDLCRNLRLYRILPEDRCLSSEKERTVRRTALVLHLHYEECFAYCYRYACSMPDTADIYLTTTTAEKKAALEALFGPRFRERLEVRVVENRGRDVSALLVGCRDLFARYELICFAHDKKSHGGEMKIVGESFADHCFQNVLGTAHYVQNILAQFECEPRLGLLTPPPPYHASHTSLIGNEWTCNFSTARKLAAELGIKVPLSFDSPPAAPFGTIFWFRTDALRSLADRGWSYSDFPPEPNGVDGTVLHALERLYPYVAQQSGYYCAWAATEDYAENYTLDLVYKLRCARSAYEHGSVPAFLLHRTKNALKKRLPENIWKSLKKIYRIIKK